MHSADVEQFLFHFQTVNRLLRQGSLQQGERRITRVQWMILREIRKHSGCTIGELAERMDVRPSTMSQMLDRLEKLRWIVRVARTDDLRARSVHLTPEGEDVIEEIEAIWLHRLEKPFLQLREDQRAALLEGMAELADKLAKTAGEAP